MQSNYKPIGKYIKEVKTRNTDGTVSNLLGVNIDKYFMPSVANIVGTDMTKYKVVKKGQFACNRMHVGRDERLPVAMSISEEDFLVSPAYDVFEIKDENILNPEYLMMWFSRKEFDRNAWFYTDADVRGGLHWKAFCEMTLPIPSLEKQKEIVAEYNIIVNRIKLNEQLNRKLEVTAQAIYKQWFVYFEFPDEHGKPYKSSGGEMVWNEAIGKEIPSKWKDGTINELIDLIDGDRGTNYPSQGEMLSEGYCLFLNAGNVTKNGFAFDANMFITEEKDNKLRKGKLQRHDVVLTTRGTVGNLAYFGKNVEYANIRINSGMIIIRGKTEPTNSFYAFLLMKSSEMKDLINSYMSGSAQPQFPIRDIVGMPVIIPDRATIGKFVEMVLPIQDDMDLRDKQIRYLKRFNDVLLAKMTKAEATA